MPVITEEKARLIFKETRTFFKKDLKSDNKSYGVDRIGNWEDSARNPTWKERSRNFDQQLAGTIITENRKQIKNKNLGHLMYGELQRQQEQGQRGGNCYDMACVAMAIANFGQGVNGEQLFMGSIRDPGDHAFLVVNRTKPVWRTISEMTASGSEAWVIDPWANTCCTGEKYEALFLAKMQKWTTDGKRIWFSTRKNNFSGWAVPTMKHYCDGFRAGPVDFSGGGS